MCTVMFAISLVAATPRWDHRPNNLPEFDSGGWIEWFHPTFDYARCSTAITARTRGIRRLAQHISELRINLLMRSAAKAEDHLRAAASSDLLPSSGETHG
jgi:hypothetical protein